MQYESERIEYKSQMVDDIYKEVIAFANTDGGVIYLGIDDKGNLVGIDDVDEELKLLEEERDPYDFEDFYDTDDKNMLQYNTDVSADNDDTAEQEE